jgi:hypothetical protein
MSLVLNITAGFIGLSAALIRDATKILVNLNGRVQVFENPENKNRG